QMHTLDVRIVPIFLFQVCGAGVEGCNIYNGLEGRAWLSGALNHRVILIPLIIQTADERANLAGVCTQADQSALIGVLSVMMYSGTQRLLAGLLHLRIDRQHDLPSAVDGL